MGRIGAVKGERGTGTGEGGEEKVFGGEGRGEEGGCDCEDKLMWML